MPLYEYQCQDCGQGFEAFVTAERQPFCPACQSGKLAKLLSRPGMVGAAAASRNEPVPFAGCGAGGDACACRADNLN